MSFTKLAAAVAMAATVVNAQSNTVPVTGILGNATIVENNPIGPIYTATLPKTEFFNPEDPRGNIVGFVTATAAESGIGVDFQVHFSNLPTSGGPFLYHIHDAPVPADGNCTGTLAHLDPFIRGETPACDPNIPQTCQVGDLSGKHGKITSDPFTANYTDDFASTLPGIGAFFGNRSITLHFANTTRITCANFTAQADSLPSSGSGSGGFNGTSGNGTSPVQPFTGAAATIKTTSLSLLGLAAAVVMLL